MTYHHSLTWAVIFIANLFGYFLAMPAVSSHLFTGTSWCFNLCNWESISKWSRYAGRKYLAFISKIPFCLLIIWGGCSHTAVPLLPVSCTLPSTYQPHNVLGTVSEPPRTRRGPFAVPQGLFSVRNSSSTSVTVSFTNYFLTLQLIGYIDQSKLYHLISEWVSYRDTTTIGGTKAKCAEIATAHDCPVVEWIWVQ